MGSVLLFRAVILLEAGGIAVLRWSQGPTPDKLLLLPKGIQERIGAPGETDESLSLALSEALGTMATVATYSTTFELRKLQVLFGRTSGGATPEDDAVITFHFLRLTSGAPSAAWVTGDFTAVETALTTMWNALKSMVIPATALRQFRWYKTGPQVDAALGGPGRTGPPVRVIDVTNPGTATAAGVGAPQVAISVTEQTSDKTAWGRFYIPGPYSHSAVSGTQGRIASSVQTTIANAVDAFYEAALAQAVPVVVYSAAKAIRTTKAGASLPAKEARALSVDQTQVDDLYDVIRSRRYGSPLLRVQRAVGS